MSVQATSWVIEKSVHSGSAFVLMFMIANHAHADGTGAYPSVATLAKECRITVRQVKRLLPVLESSGELVVFWSRGRKPHEYGVVMGEKNSDILSLLKVEYMDRMANANSDILSPLTVTSCHRSEPSNGDICDTPTVTFKAQNGGAHNIDLNRNRKEGNKSQLNQKEKEIWSGLMKQVESRVSHEVFATWFRRIECLRIDQCDGAVRCAGNEITVDWVQMYYSDLLDVVLAEIGLERFRIEWTVVDAAEVASV